MNNDDDFSNETIDFSNETDESYLIDNMKDSIEKLSFYIPLSERDETLQDIDDFLQDNFFLESSINTLEYQTAKMENVVQHLILRKSSEIRVGSIDIKEIVNRLQHYILPPKIYDNFCSEIILETTSYFEDTPLYDNDLFNEYILTPEHYVFEIYKKLCLSKRSEYIIHTNQLHNFSIVSSDIGKLKKMEIFHHIDYDVLLELWEQYKKSN